MKNRVLIVEDNPENLANALTVANNRGYSADVALSLEQGLNALKNKPDLIVTDLMIPQCGTFLEENELEEARKFAKGFNFTEKFEEVSRKGYENRESGDGPLQEIFEKNMPLARKVEGWWLGHKEDEVDGMNCWSSAVKSRGIYILKEARRKKIPVLPITNLSHGEGTLVPLMAKGYADSLYDFIESNPIAKRIVLAFNNLKKDINYLASNGSLTHKIMCNPDGGNNERYDTKESLLKEINDSIDSPYDYLLLPPATGYIPLFANKEIIMNCRRKGITSYDFAFQILEGKFKKMYEHKSVK